MAPPANNLIMSGTLIQSFRHLECQNPSIISESIDIPNGSEKMGKKVRNGTRNGTVSYSYRRGYIYIYVYIIIIIYFTQICQHIHVIIENCGHPLIIFCEQCILFWVFDKYSTRLNRDENYTYKQIIYKVSWKNTRVMTEYQILVSIDIIIFVYITIV